MLVWMVPGAGAGAEQHTGSPAGKTAPWQALEQGRRRERAGKEKRKGRVRKESERGPQPQPPLREEVQRPRSPHPGWSRGKKGVQ